MFSPFVMKILNRMNSNFIWNLYTKKCQKLINRSHFILSFDCDTEEDIKVAWDVHSQLRDMGITAVYAVPGELLKKGEKIYRKIFETPAEFINHGGREHTYFNRIHNRHASCFFYDQQTFETVKEDINQGHKILQEVLGITAKGWRTPHFGTFQKPEHLKFLYSVLNELNYTFSTSTVPEMAYRHGPIYKQETLIEIPVTGIYSEPFNIMDTWAYFAAPDRTKTPSDYANVSQQVAQFASRHPLLINIYGDPSHIYDKPEFFHAMKLLAQSSENIGYSKLIGMIHDKIRKI